MWQAGIAFFDAIFTRYFTNRAYLVLILAVVVLLVAKYRTREAMSLLGVCALLAVLFLNPVSLYLFDRVTSSARYARIFWCFPVIPGLAYVAVRLLERKKVWQRALMLVLVAAVCRAAGGTVLNGSNFGQSENWYKLPQEVIEVADKIEENSREEWGSPCVLTTVYLGTYLRQYDGNIRLLFGRGATSKSTKKIFRTMYRYADKDFSYERLFKLGYQALGEGANMIVLAKYQVQNQALETVGFVRVDETENYYIYRYENPAGGA